MTTIPVKAICDKCGYEAEEIVCDDCYATKEDEVTDLDNKVVELEDEVEGLTSTVNELEKALNSIQLKLIEARKVNE